MEPQPPFPRRQDPSLHRPHPNLGGNSGQVSARAGLTLTSLPGYQPSRKPGKENECQAFGEAEGKWAVFGQYIY